MKNPSWNPDQYLKFGDHRLRPGLELIARIPDIAPARVTDLGCGTGELTQILAGRWPTAAVTGLDSSPDMLAQWRTLSREIRWMETPVEAWQPPERPDLIFANAALHWVADHAVLFPRLIDILSPKGCLAVQMPLSWPLPSHRLMREVLADGGPGGEPLGSQALRRQMDRKWVEDPAFYYDILRSRTSHLDIWTCEYLQELQGEDPVLEWVSGSGLRPVLEGLSPSERKIFLTRYRARLEEAYPRRANGITLYPFRRLFMVAIR